MHSKDQHDSFMEFERSRFDIMLLLEDSEVSLSTIKEAALALNGSKMLSELSYSLVIESTIVSVEIQPYRSLHSLMGRVCVCHPQSLHHGEVTYPETWGTAVFFH